MRDLHKKINIAIDGPAGAGKSTVAREVANVLGYIYVDTGAMYRVVTWKALQTGLPPVSNYKLIELIHELEITFIPNDHGQQVFADGEDVTLAIRTPEVTKQVSFYSQIKEVRELLVKRQQNIAESNKGVVMDGRDIGTHVLPDAELKIFLTASVQERADRRYKEMVEKNPNQEITLEQLKSDIAKRDQIDENRENSPLIQANDAILLDCTELSASQVVEHILVLCRTILDEAK